MKHLGEKTGKENKYFALDFTGYSMYPFLKPGDRILARPVQAGQLQVGDIVVAFRHDYFVVHRLVKLLPRQKGLLKGDSLLKPDPEVTDLSSLSGRVELILRGGRLFTITTGFRSSLKGFFAFLSLYCLTPGALRLRARNTLINLPPMNRSKILAMEKRFLVEIIRELSPVFNPDLNWKNILERAFMEGLAGILYSYLKRLDIPESIRSPLSVFYRTTSSLNIIKISEMEKLGKKLRHEEIEVMTLKGASLLDHIYPDIGMRPMGDIDIMVRPEKREKLESVLSGLGYKRDRFIPHIFKKDPVMIDLHIHALNIDRIAGRAGLFPCGMAPIWNNSVSLTEGVRWLRRPDDVDNILLLSLHMMKHSFSRLIWLVDIYKILKNRNPDFWARLSERADQLAQMRSLRYTLYLLNGFFQFDPPAGSGLEKSAEGLSRFERGVLWMKINGQDINRMGPILSFLCIQGHARRMNYLLETIFPGKEVVEQEFRAYGGKRIIFYMTRIFEAMILLFRQFSGIINALIRGNNKPTM